MIRPRDDGAPSAAVPPDEPAGDTLATLAARAGLGAEGVDRLVSWLGDQLEADRFAQLERAGHNVENKIPLARVFVDLHVAPVPVGDTEGEGITEPFVAHLNKPRDERCEAAVPEPRREREGRRAVSTSDRVEGYALIGGPGQGKSTLGQLVCQLHRAWLLRPLGEGLAAREAVEAFSDGRAVADLGRPAELRFPVRIPLADAAAWLVEHGVAADTGDGAPALLGYVVERTKCLLAPVDLLRLLLAGDWLLVLDGLDEVPASSDRERLLGAARHLLGRLTTESAGHGLVVGTTRPQGYGGKFDSLGGHLRPRHLALFTRERGLAYAQRLVEARFPPEQRETVLSRLRQAAEGEATARLMRTPLQITILATLVDRIGRAPSEQWTLFREYYRVIYEREMERPFEAAELLRLYRPHIDKIHAHVGLLLQVGAEQSGGTEAALTPERFAQVVSAVLADDDIESARREDLAGRLVRAVSDRLVLLVEMRPGRLGFEIRSIQEFMAALALAQRSETVIEARIAQVARAPSFRNVVLFLASKAFTELSDLRDAFTDRICPQMNDDPDDPLARAVLAGSVLALEILEEGSGLKQTKYVRKLARLAARLVELPPAEVHGRLARVGIADEDARRAATPILEGAIRERLGVEEPAPRLGAWVTLLGLVDAEEAWAERLADETWGQGSGEGRRHVVEALRASYPSRVAKVPVGPWLSQKALAALDELAPTDSLLRGLAFSRLSRDQEARLHAFEPSRRDDPGPTPRHSEGIRRLAELSLTIAEVDVLAADLMSPPAPVRFPLEDILVTREIARSTELHEAIGTAFCRHAPSEPLWFSRNLAAGIRRVLSLRKTSLADPAIWDSLLLPLPRPERATPSTQPPPPSDHPIAHLDALTLHNLRAFDTLSLTPTPPAADRGQWIILIGDNGVGKTTLLRALVFALADISRPGVLPSAAFAAPWRSNAAPAGAPASITVNIGGTELRTDILPAGESETLQQPNAPPRRPHIFAYGCRRGSALGGATREVNYQPGAELATLFDEGADLVHAETWLLLRHADATSNPDGPPAHLWRAITGALESILPGVTRIRVHERRVVIEGEAFREVFLPALSDGYLTTIGWIIDLIARWIDLAERRKEPIPPDFLQRMTGLVLLDELDLHLYPDWQRRIVAQVRALFPRMNFVVTTHNPATLVGARADEIWILRKDGLHTRAIQRSEAPKLLGGSELYASYFGIPYLVPELAEKMQRYGFLAGSPMRTDDEDTEVHALLQKLRDEGVDPGWEPVPRKGSPRPRKQKAARP